MSKYVSSSGYTGYANQSVVWHYMTDFDGDLLGRQFVNIFSQGMLYYIPDPVGSTNIPPGTPPIGGTVVTIPQGTSFIIKEKTAIIAGEEQITKVDMILDHELDITEIADMGGSPLGVGVYSLIAIWENLDDADIGIDFYLATGPNIDALDVAGYNYVKLGEVTLYDNAGNLEISDNTTTGQTHASMYSGLIGWSGWSGAGTSGYSGYSSFSGYSGASSFSGWSGVSGAVGESGVSGYSGEGGYDIGVGVVGKPSANETVFLFTAPRNFSIADAAGFSSATVDAASNASFGFWKAESTDPTSFSLFGSGYFAAGSHTGTIKVDASPENFTAGDVFKITAPAAQDTDLEDISISILATL